MEINLIRLVTKNKTRFLPYSLIFFLEKEKDLSLFLHSFKKKNEPLFIEFEFIRGIKNNEQ